MIVCKNPNWYCNVHSLDQTNMQFNESLIVEMTNLKLSIQFVTKITDNLLCRDTYYAIQWNVAKLFVLSCEAH